MKKQLLTIALLASLIPLLSSQSATRVGTPPPKDGLRALPAPREAATWQAEDRDGYTLEESTLALPRFVVPDEGIRPPSGVQVGEEQEAPIPLLPNLGARYTPGNHARASIVDDVAGNAPGQPLMDGWEGIGPNGLTPPDPDLACGYDYTVTVTNDDFAVYDYTGAQVFGSDIHDYLGYATSYLLYDPKVIFDPWNGRWVMMWHKRDTTLQESSLVLVITGGSTPFGLDGAGAYWYDFNALQNGGTSDAAFADYFDLGYSNSFVTASGNMFRFSGGFLWGRIWVWDKSQIYNAAGAATVRFSNLTNPDGSATDSPRAVKMQTSWSEGGYNMDGTWVNSRGGGGDKITQWKITDAFGTNVLTSTDMSVGAYSPGGSATEPTGEALDTLDCRLMTAVTTTDLYGSNGVELFTSLTTDFSGDLRTRLIKLDPISNVIEMDTSFGSTGRDYWFACPAADYSGSNFWVFARTANLAGYEPEIRFVDTNKGTFSSSSAGIRDGDGSYNGFRWGDYFGGQMDWGDYSANFSLPGRPSKVWLYGEFGKDDSWGTYIGTTSVFGQGSLDSVTPGSTFVSSGPLGGPFSPASVVYTLDNQGEVGTGYEILNLPSWLTASKAEGRLDPGMHTVTLTVNSAANLLSTGVYQATITFRDTFNGGLSYDRDVELRVDVSASATYRNAGGNPASYSTSLPILGSTIIATVNVGGTTGHSFAGLVGYLSPLTFKLPAGQVLLVNALDPSGEVLHQPIVPGPVAVFSMPVPLDIALAGLPYYTQGVHIIGVKPFALSNAYDMRAGY